VGPQRRARAAGPGRRVSAGGDAGLGELLERIPALAGRVREVRALPGGLTNANHKVTTDDGVYVVRRWTADSGLLAIDRDHEHQNSLRAAEVGVGPPVIDYLPADNAMVFGFLEGTTMSAQALAGPGRMTLLAEACRRLHAARPFAGDFDMFAVQARYLALVQERGFRLPDRYLEFAPQVAAIRAALAVRPEARVPCHNDLLAENLILGGGVLRIIDFEYAGNNEPSFELGNAWSEAALPADRLGELVIAYYGRPLRHKLARARLWALMAKYGWTLWASIQDGVSTLDFDFWAWGMEKYERAVAEFDGPQLEQLLTEVTRAD
jgi:thiamine kinase-like enzyme